MTVQAGWEGRYFEDFNVGDVYRCRLGRTVTEADNIWFTLLTNNTNQIHFNRDYASRTDWGEPLVNSALTLAIVAGMGGHGGSGANAGNSSVSSAGNIVTDGDYARGIFAQSIGCPDVPTGFNSAAGPKIRERTRPVISTCSPAKRRRSYASLSQ